MFHPHRIAGGVHCESVQLPHWMISRLCSVRYGYARKGEKYLAELEELPVTGMDIVQKPLTAAGYFYNFIPVPGVRENIVQLSELVSSTGVGGLQNSKNCLVVTALLV